jgi:hypothetical protein
MVLGTSLPDFKPDKDNSFIAKLSLEGHNSIDFVKKVISLKI